MIIEHCVVDMEMCYSDHLPRKDLLPRCGSVVKTNVSCQFSQFCLHNTYPVTKQGAGIDTRPFQFHMELFWQPVFTPEFWARLAKASLGLFWSAASPSVLSCFPCPAPCFYNYWFFINMFQPTLYLRVRFWRNKPMTMNSFCFFLLWMLIKKILNFKSSILPFWPVTLRFHKIPTNIPWF